MVDLSYFAGFFDGEGCITTCRNHPDRKRWSYSLRVTTTNTNKEVIDLFQARWPGSVSIKPEKPGFKKTYTWMLSGFKGKEFLKEMLPYLIVKKREALLALDFPVREKPEGNKALSQAVYDKQEQICEQLWAIKGFAQRNAAWRQVL